MSGRPGKLTSNRIIVTNLINPWVSFPTSCYSRTMRYTYSLTSVSVSSLPK